MPATVVVGAQWGDEGKGKVVDLLAERSDVVARYQGGNNAGHTIVAGDQVYKLHLVPSGILYPDTLCVIGNGTVVDPGALCLELDSLEERGVSLDGLRIGGNAHLIMPYHVMLDGAAEMRLGRFSIGTTRRGIGPCYEDKAARVGIRVQDLLDPKILVRKLEIALEAKNEILEKLYELPRLDPAAVAEEQLAHAERLRPFIADTSLLIDQALRANRRVLFEGAQGTMLDIDHGTYPFVTSSNPIAGAACTGAGVGPTRIERVIGVSKAYVTRVGEGPFPTELDDEDGRRMLERGNEFGTTTGRQRRCGWLDLVALRYAVRLSGVTELALTKLDVLSGFARVKICESYRTREGERLTDFPYHQTVFHGCHPEYRELVGWDEDLSECRALDDLPPRARDYVGAIAEAVEVPITLIGTGQGRHQVIDQVETGA
jgi:adenylosuccinate synthase